MPAIGSIAHNIDFTNEEAQTFSEIPERREPKVNFNVTS